MSPGGERAAGSRHLAVARPALVLVLALAGCSSGVRAQGGGGAGAAAQRPPSIARAGGLRRLEYVFPDGSMYVYDMNAGMRLVAHVSLPTSDGVRGVAASPRTHILYISHGGDGGGNGDGSLLAYDLLSGRVLWDRHYPNGIDSMAISPDGRRIYMPTGELDSSGLWYVLDAGTGSVLSRIQGGTGAHNTVVGLSGRRVYLGGRNYDYLDVADTASGRVVKRIGPLRSGVRPFTINGRETLAFTTATGFLGFQVSNIASGRVLYTQVFPGFSWNAASFAPSAPSHGISLSPDERQVWVMDAPNSYVHVFDVSGLPSRAPRHIADIRLSPPMTGEVSPCSYDCARDGWLQHSLDGRFVFVGDSGDVIATRTMRVAGYLPALRQTRKMLEIDWRRSLPVATSSREGLGYVR
jgi:DNA-binding beta-propeller fold protein YncE